MLIEKMERFHSEAEALVDDFYVVMNRKHITREEAQKTGLTAGKIISLLKDLRSNLRTYQR